ncbi:MAG: helix-turn-helix transcriptional regulator [Clostridia bacterium]|nr:helix-turn-helix transcriptional regulator [Clostridia bacterium]
MKVEILIRQKRQEKGYTIDKLAKIANMSKGHLSRIEREETEPSISTLVRIAIALKMDVNELYKIHY